MNLEIGQKNPISVLNEYAVKTNSKVDYTFTTVNNEFWFKVSYNNLTIGQGQDKKKQKAKSKAAESGIYYLNSVNQANPETKLENLCKKLNKFGKYVLISKNPYLYEYHLDSFVIASASGSTEHMAKTACAESALNRIKDISSVQQYELDKKNSDKNVQTENTFIIDPRVNKPNTIDQKYGMYLENKFKSFEIWSTDSLEIKLLVQEIVNISKKYDLDIYEIGSYSMNILRNNKLILDFAIVLPSATELHINNLFESLELARLCYLESKEKGSWTEGFKIALKIDLIENTMNPYTSLPYFKFSRSNISGNMYILDSSTHPTLVHSNWVRRNKPGTVKQKVFSLVRYWRHKLSIEIPSELLDLVVENFVSDDLSLGLAFRIVIEKIASGVYLNGAVPMIQDPCHDTFLRNWPTRFKHEITKEASRTLISISQGELEVILD